MKDKILIFLTHFFSKEIATFFIAMLPVFELRLSLPLAILKFGLSPPLAFFISFLGNMLPVLPFLFFLRWAITRLERMKTVGRVLAWWFRQAEKKSSLVETYGFWGLIIFVALPFPGTGAWTGCLVATLLNFRISKAFLAISLGVIGAGLIMLPLSLLVKLGWIRIFSF